MDKKDCVIVSATLFAIAVAAVLLALLSFSTYGLLGATYTVAVISSLGGAVFGYGGYSDNPSPTLFLLGSFNLLLLFAIIVGGICHGYSG